MNSMDTSVRWHVFVRPSVPRESSYVQVVIKRCMGVEYGELFLSLSAIQKANPFRDASTNDTRTALQRMDSKTTHAERQAKQWRSHVSAGEL